jgi:hypothetical protein
MNKDTRWIAFAFFLTAITLRFVPHWHNFTPMAALALFAGCYLSGRVGLILAFGAMAFSDILGHVFGVPGMGFYNQATMLTVYLAIAATAMVGRALQGRVNVANVTAGSVAGTVIFFLSTNFVCWLDPLMDYPLTMGGIVKCYALALPFAFNTLVGDLFYSGVLFGLYGWLFASRPQLVRVRSQD